MQLPVTFLYPYLLTLIVLAVPFLWLRRKRQSAIGHPRVGMHRNVRSVPIVGRLPAIFLTLSFVALVAALARPVLPEVAETRSMETRDIIIAVDISGSMTGQLPPAQQPTSTTQPPAAAPDSSGKPAEQKPYRRLDAAEDAARSFVEARKGDRLGIMVFDDESYWHWPLSDDHKIINRKVDQINTYTGGGTNFEGPTDSFRGMGPIQASIDHFREYGKAKTKVLILVTDGESSISPQRQEQFMAQMAELGIKVYVLGVGESWTTGGQTLDLRTFTEKMNGKAFPVGDGAAMQAAFDTINQLETSVITVEKSTTYSDLYSYFAVASVLLLVLFLGSIVFTREDA